MNEKDQKNALPKQSGSFVEASDVHNTTPGFAAATENVQKATRVAPISSRITRRSVPFSRICIKSQRYLRQT